jgi:hypothetical protein
MMLDRNPAIKSRVCPKCGELSFRMYISTFFIRHYGCYCKACGYKTELNPSEEAGCQEWMMASQDDSVEGLELKNNG